MKPAHADAGRYDHLPADDEQRVLSVSESLFVARRADDLMEKRFACLADFADLMTGIELTTICSCLHQALVHVDAACHGDQGATTLILRSISDIERILIAEVTTSAYQDPHSLTPATNSILLP